MQSASSAASVRGRPSTAWSASSAASRPPAPLEREEAARVLGRFFSVEGAPYFVLRPSRLVEDELETWRRRPRLHEVRHGVGLGPPHEVDLELAVYHLLADDAVGAARAFLMLLGAGPPSRAAGARHRLLAALFPPPL